MSPLLRIWAGLAAVGAGLVHLGIAATSSPVLLVVLALIGAAELVWGVATQLRTTPPVPRIALVGALLPVLLWIVSVLAPAASTGGTMSGHDMGMAMGGGASTLLPFGPMAGASLLDLAVAALIAVARRRAAAGEPHTAVFLVGSALGAAIVAVIATTSLGGTALAAGMVH